MRRGPRCCDRGLALCRKGMFGGGGEGLARGFVFFSLHAMNGNFSSFLLSFSLHFLLFFPPSQPLPPSSPCLLPPPFSPPLLLPSPSADLARETALNWSEKMGPARVQNKQETLVEGPPSPRPDQPSPSKTLDPGNRIQNFQRTESLAELALPSFEQPLCTRQVLFRLASLDD